MNAPNPTRAQLAAIQRELLRVEREYPRWTDSMVTGRDDWTEFPSLNLKREYITPCGHTIPCEEDLEAGIDYLDAVYRRERKRGDSLAVWVWILAITSVLLLFAFILTARSVLR